jgi:predicted NBD/HSP70 family sugar kinase
VTRRARRESVATPQLLRRLNAARVLEVLRASGPVRVSDLVAATGLSRPTVDAVADDLIRLGWVTALEDDPAAAPKRGRPARRVAFRADAGFVLGVDIGEHTVRAAIADMRGNIVVERVRAFPAEAEGRERLGIVRKAIASGVKSARIRRGDLLASCVGCTGGIDADTGRVLFSGAFPGVADLNLRAEMERSVGRPVLVENDCNLAVVAERWRGVARGVDDVVCVLASERMGAGIVVSGQLVRGHAGAAGEMPFLGAYDEPHGAEGIADLVRTFAAEAVAHAQADDGPAGTSGSSWTIAAGDLRRVDAEAVFAAARAGDPLAAGIVERSVRSAARAIATLALILNPELVVIGGGVAHAGDVILEPLRRRLEELARLPPRLEASSLAERGVVVGAIRRALDDVEPRALDRLHEAA